MWVFWFKRIAPLINPASVLSVGMDLTNEYGKEMAIMSLRIPLINLK